MAKKQEVPVEHMARRRSGIDTTLPTARPSIRVLTPDEEFEDKKERAKRLKGDSREANGFFAGDFIEIE